jgi:dethiobiotin synthetase
MLFVTGTDTGAGKSVIAAGLTAFARRLGIRALAVKPIETGCALKDGRFVPEDGELLWRASGKIVPLQVCAPLCVGFAAAPARAAKIAGITFDPGDILRTCAAAGTHAEFVIVEGAGGLMVPIHEGYCMIDLAQELQCPALLVSRTRLGAINHTALSVSALRGRGISIAGVVLNHTDLRPGPEEAYLTEDVAAVIGHETPLIELPFLNGNEAADPDAIAETMERSPFAEIFAQIVSRAHPVGQNTV